MRSIPHRRGAALIVALVTLLVVMLIAATLIRSLLVAHRQSRLRQNELQAEWLAEAAVARAVVQLAHRPDYTGETWSTQTGESGAAQGDPAAGVVEIRVQKAEAQPGQVKVVVEARYPDHPYQRATARRQYTLNASPAARGASQPPSENTQ